MTQNQFVGTWKLVNTEIRGDEGKITPMFGSDATGIIIYTEQGYMSAHINIPNPPDAADTLEVFLGPLTPEQIAAVGIPKENFSYGGKYEIQDEVIHHAEYYSHPIFGGDQPRSFEFTGNQLILSKSFAVLGKNLKACLIWERV
jgi:hypothetical protein